MTDAVLVEAIIKIGNHPEVIKICEPQVAFPMTLQNWMVIRTLKAQELLQEQWEDSQRRTK